MLFGRLLSSHNVNALTPMPPSQASIDDFSTYDSEEEYRLAQQEWEETVQQLHLLVSVVVLPFFGKYLGRRWSQWGLYTLVLLDQTSHIENCSLCAISSPWIGKSLLLELTRTKRRAVSRQVKRRNCLYSMSILTRKVR